MLIFATNVQPVFEIWEGYFWKNLTVKKVIFWIWLFTKRWVKIRKQPLPPPHRKRYIFVIEDQEKPYIGKRRRHELQKIVL